MWLAVLALAGCGSHVPNAAPSATATRSALQGSPPALASLHAQADQLLGGGVSAFQARLAGLRGYPIVVNKWGSWCPPCQSEFPVFQQVSVTYGRRVAFLGIDGNDHRQAAAAFLRSYPVSYPSYFDSGSRIAAAVQAGNYFPQTLYFDRRGHMVFDHVGPYESAGALARDVRRYVLTSA